MTQKTGRFGASGREFCLYSLEKEDIEETLQLMDRCVGENLYLSLIHISEPTRP